MSAAPSVQDPTRKTWHLTFHASGGVAGLDREVDLANTGDLRVVDRRRGIVRNTQAPAKELAEIASLVADLKPAETVRGADCRDCLQYDLRVQSDGRSLVYSVNDVSLIGTPLERLVNLLTIVLNRELSEPPKRLQT